MRAETSAESNARTRSLWSSFALPSDIAMIATSWLRIARSLAPRANDVQLLAECLHQDGNDQGGG